MPILKIVFSGRLSLDLHTHTHTDKTKVYVYIYLLGSILTYIYHSFLPHFMLPWSFGLESMLHVLWNISIWGKMQQLVLLWTSLILSNATNLFVSTWNVLKERGICKAFLTCIECSGSIPPIHLCAVTVNPVLCKLPQNGISCKHLESIKIS